MDLKVVSDKRLQQLDQLLGELLQTIRQAGLQITPEAESLHQLALQVSEVRRERLDAINLELVQELTAQTVQSLTISTEA